MNMTLLRLQFRAMGASWLGRKRKSNKSGKGYTVLMAGAFLYLAVVMLGMFGFLFSELVTPYHTLGLDWLYFAIAGIMSLGIAVFGSVFSTQTQLYESKDNALLLSMPIPPSQILLCRMVPLLVLNLAFGALVLLPAGVVYGLEVGFSALALVGFALSLLFLPLISQAIACLLGWGLHLLLSRMNKSLASMIYLVAFLAIYFTLYSQAQSILQAMAVNGAAIGGSVKSFVWPLYAMGLGCCGQLGYLVAFLAIAAVVFAVVYRFLSATFLKTTTMSRTARRKKALELDAIKSSSPVKAIIRKELKHFLASPVYLTNMSLGLLMMLVLPIAMLFFRGTLLEVLELMEFRSMTGIFLSATLGFLVSTNCISTPSVSLEGKSLWILRAMPLSARQVLLGKLGFHCLLTVPVSMLSGGITAAILECSLGSILLCALIPGAMSVFCGVFGMICGLKFARFDWINESYPCKQSISVLIVMMTTMLVPIALMFLYMAVLYDMMPELFLLLVAAGYALVDGLLLYAMLTWGAKKWDSLT